METKSTENQQLQQKEEEKFTRPDFMSFKWTEYDPLSLTAKEGNTEIKLMTYRLAVKDGVERKGLVFFVHGYGGYCEHHAYAFRLLAENGYEVMAMDMRGFGNSQGYRFFFGSSDILYSDYESFIEKTMEKYQIDSQVTPLFLVGLSFGGLTSFNLSVKHQGKFKGMALVAPFFKTFDNTLYRIRPIIKVLKFFSPKLQPTLGDGRDPEFRQKYNYMYGDPKNNYNPRVHTMDMFIDMQRFAEASIEIATTPYIIITAGKEVCVNNEFALEIQQKIKNEKNKHVCLEESDHMTIFVEDEELKVVMKHAVEYFDSLLQTN